MSLVQYVLFSSRSVNAAEKAIHRAYIEEIAEGVQRLGNAFDQINDIVP